MIKITEVDQDHHTIRLLSFLRVSIATFLSLIQNRSPSCVRCWMPGWSDARLGMAHTIRWSISFVHLEIDWISIIIFLFL